jgi:DUF1009 family protein
MPPEAPKNKYWLYVDGAGKGDFRGERQAVVRAKGYIKDHYEVVIIELRYKQDYRLHVWINGVQTVKNGKNTGK